MTRRLELVVLARAGALPIVIAASVTPACGSKSGLLEPGTSVASGGSAASGGAGGIGGGGGTVISGGGSGGIVFGGGGTGGLGGSGGQSACEPFQKTETYEVALPPEGVPAEPGQICAVSAVPVPSGRAAHVTLLKLGTGPDLAQASGFVEIDPDLFPLVIGQPTLEVIDATHPALSQMQITSLVKQSGGWAFQASFPGPLFIEPSGFTNLSPGRMTVRIAFEVDCSPNGPSKVVHAATDIHVCQGEGQIEWVSSGDSCTVCTIIAEMAPSPIVPDGARNDDLPLARALRLRIVELARISNTLVLLSEHDGGDGCEYEWQASAGRVERLAPDIVAWTLEEGMAAPFIQVAVHGPSALGVASHGFNEAA